MLVESIDRMFETTMVVEKNDLENLGSIAK